MCRKVEVKRMDSSRKERIRTKNKSKNKNKKNNKNKRKDPLILETLIESVIIHPSF